MNFEEKRAAIRAKRDVGKAAQLEKDETAILELEERAIEPLKVFELPSYTDGAPVLIAHRYPTSVEYKRFSKLLRTAKDKDAQALAQDSLSRELIVYPSEATTVEKLLESYPTTLHEVTISINDGMAFKARVEGKD
jgi:hypothetical protein